MDNGYYSEAKGGFASPESAAHIMAQKFVMGVPLYRQEQELLRSGIPLSRWRRGPVVPEKPGNAGGGMGP